MSSRGTLDPPHRGRRRQRHWRRRALELLPSQTVALPADLIPGEPRRAPDSTRSRNRAAAAGCQSVPNPAAVSTVFARARRITEAPRQRYGGGGLSRWDISG